MKYHCENNGEFPSSVCRLFIKLSCNFPASNCRVSFEGGVCSHMATRVQPLAGRSYTLPSRGIILVYEIEWTESECPEL